MNLKFKFWTKKNYQKEFDWCYVLVHWNFFDILGNHMDSKHFFVQLVYPLVLDSHQPYHWYRWLHNLQVVNHIFLQQHDALLRFVELDQVANLYSNLKKQKRKTNLKKKKTKMLKTWSKMLKNSHFIKNICHLIRSNMYVLWIT